MLLSTAALMATFIAVGAGSTVQAKQKAAPAKHKNYLVPPPPAYTPSFVTNARGYTNTSSNPYTRDVDNGDKTEEEAAEPAEKDKHFYTRDGYQEPKAVKPNRYVTYWNKS